MRKPKFQKSIYYKTILLIVLSAVLLSASIWGVTAKYTQEETKAAIVQARVFYFTSDLLVEGGEEYELNPGTESVTFLLRNHEDGLRYSEDSIQYHIFVNGVEDTSKSGTMAVGSGNDVTVTIGGLENGKSYEIKAQGVAGYQKELSATFRVKSVNEAVYKHLQDSINSPYVLLTVWAQNVSGELQVTIPAGLIPDDTDPVLDSQVNNYAGGYGAATITETISTTYGSRTYRFFKANPTAKFDVAQFGVTLNGITAEPGTP